MSDKTTTLALLEEELKEMEMHEEKKVNRMTTVLRVFNGWIYQTIAYETGLGLSVSSVFVPEKS